MKRNIIAICGLLAVLALCLPMGSVHGQMQMLYIHGPRLPQWKECASDPTFDGQICKPKPALNNQCPVCGEMAEPYVRQRVAKWSDCKGGVAPTSMSDCYWTPSGPTERITRCRRCSAAFWQNSEGAK